ncbi:MAG: aldo/keto reductase [bacterium]
MQYCELGTTGIEVSRVAMGCWAIVGDATWGPQDEQDALRTIEAALDLGINFFDTAEGYGDGYSEELLGRALTGRHNEAVIATKVSQSNLHRNDVIAACDASLKRLGRDCIDLYQVHWPTWDVPMEETFSALEKLRDQGKVRAIGVSNFGPRDLSDAIRHTRIESNQLPYNLLLRAIEHDVQPVCAEHGIGILCYSPLAQGLLTGKFAAADDVPEGRARTRHFSGDRAQARHGEPGHETEMFNAIHAVKRISERINQPMADVALAWLLQQPAVTSVLAGARRIDQVSQNAAAAELELDDATLAELDEATRPLKDAMGVNPDPWLPADNARMR